MHYITNACVKILSSTERKILQSEYLAPNSENEAEDGELLYHAGAYGPSRRNILKDSKTYRKQLISSSCQDMEIRTSFVPTVG
jgi:hypothetical protein